MAFDWFRRKFNKNNPTSPEEVAAPPASPEAQSTEEVASSQLSPDAAADRLQWAKAAYKNIQQQAQPKSASDQSSIPNNATDDVEPVATATAEAEPTAAQLSSVEVPLAQNQQATAANEVAVTTPETLPTVEVATELSGDASITTESSEELIATTSTQTTPLSFLARAEAERQARLERLKATAIEVPPEVVPAAIEQTIPDLAFDEGFMWSAEILAAQGRRPEDVSLEEITWLQKLRQGLGKTRRNLVNQLKAIVGQGPLNAAAVMEIEALLLQADVGVEATDHIINTLQNKLKQEALPADAAIAYLKQILRDLLDRPLESHKPIFVPEKDALNIWLITGVNGAGKTTTIGKIAHIAQKSGYKCLIGAADTFRAAAVEQVKVWGARSGVEVIANPGQNTDPAAVVYDAIAAAQARSTQLLLVDTAGRLQNKKNLMDELSKIRRIVDKKAANAKIESLLVLDATLGQNGLRQAEVFAQAAQLSGVVLTKLDGTAKGGVALAVVQQLNLPIRFIGAGEGIEDLRPFSSYEFVEALLGS